jgi:hypothetical protein
MLERAKRREKITGRVRIPFPLFKAVPLMSPLLCSSPTPRRSDALGSNPPNVSGDLRRQPTSSGLFFRLQPTSTVADDPPARHSVRLVDNSSDDHPPTIVYDSAKDPRWLEGDEGARVDVRAFVEARLIQLEDGRVVEKGGESLSEGRKALM